MFRHAFTSFPYAGNRHHGGRQGASRMGRCAEESWFKIFGIPKRASIDARPLAARQATGRRLDRRSQLTVLALLTLLVVSVSTFAAPNLHADRIVIIKSKRTLTLYSGGKELRSYRVALGGAPVGPKTRQGDHRTPEGVYRIDAKNSKSQFHLALHVSYPNTQDRAQAAKLRVNP